MDIKEALKKTNETYKGALEKLSGGEPESNESSEKKDSSSEN